MEMKAVLRVTIELKRNNQTYIKYKYLYFSMILPQPLKDSFRRFCVILFIKIVTKYKKVFLPKISFLRRTTKRCACK